MDFLWTTERHDLCRPSALVSKDVKIAEMIDDKIAKGEKETKELLLQFEEAHPNITKDSNVDEIAETLQIKSDRATILAELRKQKK